MGITCSKTMSFLLCDTDDYSEPTTKQTTIKKKDKNENEINSKIKEENKDINDEMNQFDHSTNPLNKDFKRSDSQASSEGKLRRAKSPNRRSSSFRRLKHPERVIDLDQFKNMLKEGILCNKFSFSSKGKMPRIVYCDADAKKISWRAPSSGKGIRRGRSFSKKTIAILDIRDIIEIRHGTEEDPSEPGKHGTATLRRSCDVESSRRVFSIIWPNRTLDLEASSEQEADRLYYGFRQLWKSQTEGIDTINLNSNQSL